jgi:hypothetical protein
MRSEPVTNPFIPVTYPFSSVIDSFAPVHSYAINLFSPVTNPFILMTIRGNRTVRVIWPIKEKWWVSPPRLRRILSYSIAIYFYLTINSMAQNFSIEKHCWRSLFFGNLATVQFSGKWMASAAPSGHLDYEYVIGSALKCPEFKCRGGQTDRQTHISALYYIDLLYKGGVS